MIGDLHLRFETRASKPPVFRCTEPLIASAKARSRLAKTRICRRPCNLVPADAVP